jgi:hypothetical protein
MSAANQVIFIFSVLSELLGVPAGSGKENNVQNKWSYKKIWENFPPDDKINLKLDFPNVADYCKLKSHENDQKNPRTQLRKQRDILKTDIQKAKTAEEKKMLQTSLKKMFELFAAENCTFEAWVSSK